MPSRGSSTRVAFTAFLGWNRGQSHRPPRRGGAVSSGESDGLGRWSQGCLGRWSYCFWVNQLTWKRSDSEEAGPSEASLGSQIPVLNSLRRGGCPEFGHEDADNVEEKDKVDLQLEHNSRSEDGQQGWGHVAGIYAGNGGGCGGQARTSALSALFLVFLTQSLTLPSLSLSLLSFSH